MRRFKSLSILFVVILICTCTIIFISSFNVMNAAEDDTLRSLAEKLSTQGREFYIGCAVPSNLSSADESLIKKEFNIVTCENDMKIGTISPGGPNQYNYSGGDRLVNLAKSANMVVHGHAFVWHKYNPGWVDGTKSMMETYISNVGAHFKGKIYAWDVVNEAIHRDGSYRINAIGSNGQDGASIFGQKQTKQYIEDAFKAAYKADPNAKLLYNDYAIETNDAKFNGMYEMLKDLKSRNVPIHGVGFQVHLDSSFTEADAQGFADKMQKIADLGLESYVTEMDVGCSSNSQAGLEQQADIYYWVTKACLEQPKCVALQVWGIRDSQSWRINPDAPEDRAIAPLIFNDNGERKPAYYGIQRALQEAVSGNTSTTSASTKTPTTSNTITTTTTTTTQTTTAITTVPTTIATVTPTQSTGTGSYNVSYSSNDWGSGATITVTIANNGTSSKNGWKLTWTFSGNQKITNLWGGTYTQSGSAVTVTNAPWNSSIPAGASISFGFNISYSGTNAKPTDFKVE